MSVDGQRIDKQTPDVVLAASMTLSASPEAALRTLHYTFSVVLLASFSIMQLISICTLQKLQSQYHSIQRKPFVVLQATILLLYTIDLSLLVFETVLGHPYSSSPDSRVYASFGVFIWILLTATLIEAGPNVVWFPFYSTWIMALIAEATLFGLEIAWTTPFTQRTTKPLVYLRASLQVLRLASLVLLLLFYFYKRRSYQSKDDEESASLLGSANTEFTKKDPRGSSLYGSMETAFNKPSKDGDEDAEQDHQDQTKQSQLHPREHSGNWASYLRSFLVFVPLIWPARHVRIQWNLLGVFICLIIARLAHVLMPRQLGMIIDSLIGTSSYGFTSTVLQMLLFLLYCSLASRNVLDILQGIFWLPCEQHAARSIKAAVHRHLICLSRDFQTKHSSRESMRSIGQVTNVIWLLRKAICLILPSMLDIFLSGVYLSYVFGTYVTLVFCVTATLYIWVWTHDATKRVNAHRSVFQWDRNEAPGVFERIGVCETMGHLGGQVHQTNLLLATVSSRHLAHFRSSWPLFQSSLCQEVIKRLGLAVASALVLHQVFHGIQSIGNFAMMIVYSVCAEYELHLLTAICSSFLKDLSAAETIRDLLLTDSSIKDGCTSFKPFRGAVLFDEISFGYNEKKALIKNFSFSAEAGQHVALVGETGSGKTTLLRLLFRFYDVQRGKIMIDGQDIRDVTLRSLRNVMGIVPQDPFLFDASIMENVRYSRHRASDEEVVEACKAAAIHDKILTYADGYQTRVGEHGIKLSKDEIQQIAIARVLLQNPKIVLLEEPTSSMESQTESLVQLALRQLWNGRTTFTIAHKWSTVMHSDVILVMKDGIIIEQGSPSELMNGESQYSRIWMGHLGNKRNTLPGRSVAIPESCNIEQAIPTINGHISERSGSSFRADAPEFVPHQQHNGEASHGNLSQVHRGIGHHQNAKTGVSPACEHDDFTEKNDRGLSKRMDSDYGNNNSKTIDRSRVTLEPVNTKVGPLEADSKDIERIGETASPNQPLPRLNRWHRRRQTKSEPHGSAIDSSRADSISENLTSIKIESRLGPRRVSGHNSAKPDHSPINVKLPFQKTNRKRKRQVRIKKTENPDSESGTISGETSHAQSNNIPIGPKPKISLSTPSHDYKNLVDENVIPIASSSKERSASNVRFAPEA